MPAIFTAVAGVVAIMTVLFLAGGREGAAVNVDGKIIHGQIRSREILTLSSDRWEVQLPSKWEIGHLGHVQMSVEDTHQYELDTDEGAEHWAKLAPKNGMIHLDNNSTATISMFHQLRCLDVLRVALVQASRTKAPPGPRVRHCLNYIRQMILCRSDLRLENVRDPVIHAVDLTSLHTCQDWRKVYSAVERNHASHAQSAP